MKHLFIDTNIIIDFVSQRIPFGKSALLLFNLADKKKVKLYCSSHAIATAHYILKKGYKENQIRKVLDSVMDYLQIVPVSEDILRKAVRSKHKDFEDAIQILSAYTIKNLFAIVTRDINDFSTAEVPVFTPDEAIERLQS